MTDIPPPRQRADDPSATDVAALAAKLSLSQRNTVLNLGWADSARPSAINAIVRRALLAAGLLRPIGKLEDKGYELTLLGEAVREHILKGQQEC
jgi:hypothetical protein